MHPAPSQWFAVAARPGSAAYRVGDTGWFLLQDGTELPPDGWRRQGDLLVQPATGFAIDGRGSLRPLAADELGAEAGGASYTITADMFGLYIRPAGGGGAAAVALSHIPLVVYAEPPIPAGLV
jgi:hypothetical protein